MLAKHPLILFLIVFLHFSICGQTSNILFTINEVKCAIDTKDTAIVKYKDTDSYKKNQPKKTYTIDEVVNFYSNYSIKACYSLEGKVFTQSIIRFSELDLIDTTNKLIKK